LKILITGGTGFIGKALCKKLTEKGIRVNILTRNKSNPSNSHFFWNPESNKIDDTALEGISGIIHLAGLSIAKRWTNKYKQEIIESRVQSAQFLHELCIEKNIKLDFFISASGINYYGNPNTKTPLTEEDASGTDFLSKVCFEWEKVACKFEDISKKVVILRTGIVLDKNGGALLQLLPLFRNNLGSAIGTGKQIMPWISLTDLVNMYIFAIEKQLNGVFNAVHPEIISNENFSRALAQSLKKYFVPISVPTFVLYFLKGEMSAIILKGNAISGDKIKKMGFQFQYKNVTDFFEKQFKM